MSLASFGSGILYATPSGANPTPVQFGALQDVTVDLSRTTKTLFGQFQQALAIGGGELKATGKAKIGYINGAIYSSLFYGVASSAGTVLLASNEADSVPASTPYTVTTANSANWTNDLGVTYAGQTKPLQRVASAPAAGQYSVAAGVYTFAAGDAGKAVSISYEYSNASSGQTISVGTILQGVQPIVTIDLYRGFNGTGVRERYWACVCSKLSTPSKMADFGINEFDFEAFTDGSGRFHTIYTDE